PTQAVPPPSEMNGSIVLWKVRVDQMGDFPIKVRSSNGVIYNTQLKIEPSDKSEIIRIEPPGTEPEKSPGPSPLPAPKPKATPQVERLRTELRDVREKLLKMEVVQADFEKRTKAAVSDLKDMIAKLGANDPKAKDLQRQLDELLARGKEMVADMEARRALT